MKMNKAKHAVAWATGCTLACVGLTAGPAQASTATDVAVRMVTQEGLAIALASNVLVSQETFLLDFTKVGECKKGKPGFGSGKLISDVKTGKKTANAEVAFYFDTECKVSYIDEKAQAAKTTKDTISITATETYTGLQGQTLGSQSLNESVTVGNKTIVLIGLGTFTPATGAPAVDLGLTCTFATANGNGKCEGGIAQPFPALNMSLASVTPLSLTFGGPKGATVYFRGADPNRETGDLGALSIDEANDHALGIAGTGTSYGKASTKGTAAKLALFPPTPTHWEITDKAHGVKFSLKVVDDKSRDVAGTVISLADGSTLATITADQSGTGTIAYAGEGTEAITSWLLAD